MRFRDRLGLSVSQAVVAWGLVLLIGGAAGLFAMLICNYLLYFGGEDSSDKHGISTVRATRLGGVAIVTYVLVHLGYQAHLGAFNPFDDEAVIICICILFFLIGVYEDLSGLLSAKVRLLLMLIVGLLAMNFVPHLVLQPIGIILIDRITTAAPVVAGLFTALCLVFMSNAYNTADGANGLVSGVSAFTFAALVTVAPPNVASLLLAALVGCCIFLAFNLVNGRFLLGDGGAYFLGSLVGLSLVAVVNTADVSLWWLLSFAFYPVADLLWSIGRRLRLGVSPLKADDDHFHNLLFTYLDSDTRSSARTNTITGISISFLFAGLQSILTTAGGWPADSDAWFFWVLGQSCVYALGRKYLKGRLCLSPSASECDNLAKKLKKPTSAIELS